MSFTLPTDFISIAKSGLQPQTAQPKKVIVVGAGMAGLVAAYELQLDFANPNQIQTAIKRWTEIVHEAVQHVTEGPEDWDELLERYGDHSL